MSELSHVIPQVSEKKPIKPLLQHKPPVAATQPGMGSNPGVYATKKQLQFQLEQGNVKGRANSLNRTDSGRDKRATEADIMEVFINLYNFFAFFLAITFE